MSAPNGGQRLLWYVTSPNERCGIREYSNYLVSLLHLFGPGRGWACHAAWGSPEEVLEQLQEGMTILLGVEGNKAAGNGAASGAPRR